jgi:hypothetical protein
VPSHTFELILENGVVHFGTDEGVASVVAGGEDFGEVGAEGGLDEDGVVALGYYCGVVGWEASRRCVLVGSLGR